jgi:selenocysteine lyase/cysteine desulfurase
MTPEQERGPEVGDEFPVTKTCMYLNHAAIAPWPRRTQEAVARFAIESACEGGRRVRQWADTERQLRGQLAHLINAPSADDIALQKNTSEALSVIAFGFPWQVGDNVVIAAEEFPSNRIVWEALADRGVSVRQVELGAETDPEAALERACDARTRLLSISSVQYASGLRLDLVRLGDICRSRDIAFCVDAIQGLGAVVHDVQAMHADFLVADAHKWLLGPEGIAVFYCSARWRDRLRLHEYGWHMVEDPDNFDRRTWRVAASARRFECGSPNRVGIHGLAASLSLLTEIGIAEIERRIAERAAYIVEAISRRAALEPISAPDPRRRAGIVTFRHRGTDALRLWHHLTARNVVCAVRAGGVRFSPHFYVPLSQLADAFDAIDGLRLPR